MQESLACLPILARIWIDPVPSGMKSYALGFFCRQRVGDLLVLQLVFPGRVNRNFSYLSVFLCFPPFSHLGYCVNFVLQLGRVSPMSTVLTLAPTGGWRVTHGVGEMTFCHVAFNRWLTSDSRCETQMTGGHSAFQPVVEFFLLTV